MGDAPPTVRGIGDPIGTDGGFNRISSLYGESDMTRRVWSASVTRSGAATIETTPTMRRSMPLLVRFDAGAMPLPLRIRICLPSLVNTAEVGYQPVGMNPSTKLRAGLPTSTTATALLSALATISVRPSGDNATELGVAVGGACGYKLVEICSSGSPVNVSYTHTAALLAQATNSRLPSLEIAIAFGCSPAGHSLNSRSESAS